MIGRNTVKRAIRRGTGWAAVLESRLAPADAAHDASACVFYYHRVAEAGFIDPHVDDWNVSPRVFERQVAVLSEFAEIVPLLELPDRLAQRGEDGRGASRKPLVSLTFDDGYASFYTQALPVLRRYGAPATAFVVTSTVGHEEPQPFDGWALKHARRTDAEAWRAMTWDELEACAATELVHIGAHSHRHLRGRRCTAAQLSEEAARSREILRARLGPSQARAYAYPYGSTRLRDVSPAYISAVREAGYEVAVTTDLGMVARTSERHALPRIEAHALDVPGVLKAKAVGALASYRLTDRLRLVNNAL